MNYSKNIIFNESILSSEKASVHKQHLKIATYNLDNYNNRVDKEIQLKYDEKDFKFDYLIYSDENAHLKTIINSYCFWALHPEKDTNGWIEPHLDFIKNKKDGVLMYICNPFFKDYSFFTHLRDKFIKEYQNNYPIGFLNEDSEQRIKKEVNSYCEELLSIWEK